MKPILEEANILDKFYFTQIKEKFGTLRLYNSGLPKEGNDLVMIYEHLSSCICVKCGEPATKESTEWICPWCDKCANKQKGYERFTNIKDNPQKMIIYSYSKEGRKKEEYDITYYWKLYKYHNKHKEEYLERFIF